VELATSKDLGGPFFRVHIEGLASLLLGLCVCVERSTHGILDVERFHGNHDEPCEKECLQKERFKNKMGEASECNLVGQRPPSSPSATQWILSKKRCCEEDVLPEQEVFLHLLLEIVFQNLSAEVSKS